MSLIITHAPIVEADRTNLQIAVAPGDTLSSIANRYLGSANRWIEISQLNELIDPDKLDIGQLLIVPVSTMATQSQYRCNYQILASSKDNQNPASSKENGKIGRSGVIISVDNQGTSVAVLSGSASVTIDGTTVAVPEGKVTHSKTKGCVSDVVPTLSS